MKVPPSSSRPPGAHGIRRPRRMEHAKSKGAGGGEEPHADHEDVSQELNPAELKKAMAARQRGEGDTGGQQGQPGEGGAGAKKADATSASPSEVVAKSEERMEQIQKPRRKTYEAIRAAVGLESALKPEAVEKQAPSESKPPPPGRDATAALNNSQPPGVFFIEDSEGGPAAQDLELEAAVEEVRAVLRDVPGILHVGSGVDETEAPVVIVSVGKGATQASVEAIPPRARQFATVVAVPYELLPLRRERFGRGGGAPVL